MYAWQKAQLVKQLAEVRKLIARVPDPATATVLHTLAEVLSATIGAGAEPFDPRMISDMGGR